MSTSGEPLPVFVVLPSHQWYLLSFGIRSKWKAWTLALSPLTHFNAGFENRAVLFPMSRTPAVTRTGQ